MILKGKVTFLGCGGSVGVPMIGCSCPVCLSDSPFNKRLRTSILIEWEKHSFLVDTGPDFRQQALRNNLHKIDGLLLTHSHQDHIGGLDDLRPFHYYRQSPIPVLLSKETAEDIIDRFYYFFNPAKEGEPFVERFKLTLLPGLNGEITFEGLPIRYVSYEQAGMNVTGYRFGDFAYITDIRHYESTIFDSLRGVKYLVISALRMTPSAIHFSVDEAIDFSKKIGAEKTWLTHLSHELDYEQTNSYLPETIRLAYDGLQFNFGS